MKIATYENIPWISSPGTRGGGKATSDAMKAKGQEGFQYKRLFTGELGAPGNFEMVVLKTESSEDIKHYPRHRHAFEQMRMSLKGNPDWTPGSVTPEGWVIYVGAGTYYGPYDRQAGHEQLHIQFQGAGCPPFLNYEQMTKARDGLIKKGSFEKGVFTWVDEQGQRHNKDGHAAVIEFATGQPVVMPQPRFETPVNMNPEASLWNEIDAGVEAKELGSFTEGKTRVGFLHIRKGATYAVPDTDQKVLLFVNKGKGSVNGSPISERDEIMLEPGDSGIEIGATDDLVIFAMALPHVEATKAEPVGKHPSLVA